MRVVHFTSLAFAEMLRAMNGAASGRRRAMRGSRKA